MRPLSPLQQKMLGVGSVVLLAPLAVMSTWHFSAFRSTPWTLAYLVIAFVAEVGGGAELVAACLIEACGIYRLVLAPGPHPLLDRDAWVQTAAFLATAAFITYLVRQRRWAVRSLETGERHYRSVAETAPDVVITIDEESRIMTINPAVKAVFGYEPGELIGEPMLVLMPERLHTGHLEGFTRHLATGERRIPWTGVQLPGRRKGGEEIPLEISFASYESKGGRRFTGFIRDVSERHRTQAALMQSEKLAAVGRLASSIAHEINNPLEAVTNLLYLSRESTDLGAIQEYLEQADQELRRVSVIANQTLQFHKHSSSPTEVECDDLIDGCLALYQGKLINALIVVERRRRARRTLVCVEGEIRQVLNNLIGNAVDAMLKGGRLVVRSRDAVEAKSGRAGVVLTIADTGTGISPLTRARMFEAFFTTKGNGGAGLGLWISSQLVAKNGGSLRMRSRQGPGQSGTVFALFLPGGSGRTAAGEPVGAVPP